MSSFAYDDRFFDTFHLHSRFRIIKQLLTTNIMDPSKMQLYVPQFSYISFFYYPNFQFVNKLGNSLSFSISITRSILLSLKLVSAVFCFFTKWWSFRNYRKRFLFQLKSSFCFWDIQLFWDILLSTLSSLKGHWKCNK